MKNNYATSQKNLLKKNKKNETNHETSQNCIGPSIRIVRKIQCLPYADFFFFFFIYPQYMIYFTKTNYSQCKIYIHNSD